MEDVFDVPDDHKRGGHIVPVTLHRVSKMKWPFTKYTQDVEHRRILFVCTMHVHY
jgi:hypothetical protein